MEMDLQLWFLILHFCYLEVETAHSHFWRGLLVGIHAYPNVSM